MKVSSQLSDDIRSKLLTFLILEILCQNLDNLLSIMIWSHFNFMDTINNKFLKCQIFLLKMSNIGWEYNVMSLEVEVVPSIACLEIIPPDNFVVKLCFGYWWSSSILVIISVLARPDPRLLLTMNFWWRRWRWSHFWLLW